jgi:hypothetical protein
MFLASSMVEWITGQDLVVDGGVSVHRLGNACSGPGEGTNPGCRVRPVRQQLGAPAEAEGRPNAAALSR